MNKIFLYTTLLFSLAACTSDPEEQDKTTWDTKNEHAGEITHIETLFDETVFPSSSHEKLLLELDICDTVPPQESGCSTCTPRYFKLHEFKKGVSIEDAFLLQIRALSVLKGQGVQLPVRHLIVFERENGALVKVNGFRGNLIATRESTSGVKDIIVRFYIAEDDAFINCLFEWKDGQYKFVSAEAIDGAGGSGAVKAEVKDSISTIVYQSLMENAMLF